LKEDIAFVGNILLNKHEIELTRFQHRSSQGENQNEASGKKSVVNPNPGVDRRSIENLNFP
jgi:hypothetical protein